jgi:hypothetical protein
MRGSSDSSPKEPRGMSKCPVRTVTR